MKEIEFKYNGNNINQSELHELIKKTSTIKRDLTLDKDSSIDTYYSDGTRFMRWREGLTKDGNKTWELTSKSKTSELNNNIREETNLTLNSSTMNQEKVKSFSEMHGLRFDFQIKKDVKVYWTDKVVLSYYTTFTMDGKKLDTFIEIEADEKFKWESEEQAFAEINEWEKKFAPLGITPQHRIKKSLFEFYTKFK